MSKKKQIIICVTSVLLLIIEMVIIYMLLPGKHDSVADTNQRSSEALEPTQVKDDISKDDEYDFSDVDIYIPNDYYDEDEDDDKEDTGNERPSDLTWDAEANVWRTAGDDDEVPVDPDVYEEVDFDGIVAEPPTEVPEEELVYYYRDGDNEMLVDGDVEGTGDPEIFICSKDVNVVGGLSLEEAPLLDWGEPVTGGIVGGRSIAKGNYRIVSGSIDLDPQMYYTAYRDTSLILYTVPTTEGHSNKCGAGELITIEDMKIYHVYDLVLEKVGDDGLW